MSRRLGFSPSLSLGIRRVLSRVRGTSPVRRYLQLAVLLVAATAACALPPPARSLILQVSNQLGRAIGAIRIKSCGDLDLAFSPIEGFDLAPGESRGLRLPPTCVDLVAYDLRGRLVGEQRGLVMRPDASWVLRR